ncbi:MAG: tRNA (adenosine(37)-N6)-dimethylallyltransferase MiaA, partial [Proteobacteria bacterium]|nr:tRNA (adenosine(37)-N6)-dimethylallyltransferase MiaA [Pseudomonadota bacterium]
SVLNRGHAPQVKSLQSIGYKQMVSFIQGLSSWDEAVSQIKKATKRLAKRQLTWFRHDPEIVWIKLPEQAREVPLTVKNFLKFHVN